MHICVSKLTIIGSDNGVLPGRRQAIIWTNAGILLIWPKGTNFSEILNEIWSFSLKKMHLNVSAILSRRQCVNTFNLANGYRLCVFCKYLTHWGRVMHIYLRHRGGSSLVPIMACHLLVPIHYLNKCWCIFSWTLLGAKPLSEPMLVYCQLDPWE